MQCNSIQSHEAKTAKSIAITLNRVEMIIGSSRCCRVWAYKYIRNVKETSGIRDTGRDSFVSPSPNVS